MKNASLYWFLSVVLTLVVILALGGGVWGAEQSIGHWTGRLFQQVCHQNPMRSLTFNGVPMAVNSRCFGVFTGLWAGWLAIPFFIRTSTKKYWRKWFLLLAVMLQIIDYTGNHFLWENTNFTRTAFGCLLGMAVALFLLDLFQSKKI